LAGVRAAFALAGANAAATQIRCHGWLQSPAPSSRQARSSVSSGQSWKPPPFLFTPKGIEPAAQIILDIDVNLDDIEGNNGRTSLLLRWFGLKHRDDGSDRQNAD
jgi:hypothetical protein